MAKISFHIIPLITISLVSICLYASTVYGSFLYDDIQFLRIRELRHVNTALRTAWVPIGSIEYGTTSEGYRPLSMLSYAGNFIFFGEYPWSFHLVNILLHACVSMLVYILIWSLFGRRSLSVFTSLLFVSLPIHSENVAAIKYREDMLSALYMMVAWIFFLRSQKKKGASLWMSAISSMCYLASLLSKELLFFSCIIFWLVDKNRYSRYKSILYTFGPALMLYGIIRVGALGEYAFDVSVPQKIFDPLAGYGFFPRFFTMGKLAWMYFSKTLIPYHFSVTYGSYHISPVLALTSSYEAICGFFLIAVLILFSLYKWYSPIGVGAIIFLVSFFPLSKLYIQAADIFAERWMYFPSLGIVLILGAIFSYFYDRYPTVFLRAGVICSYIILLNWYTQAVLSRNRIWRDPETFYTAITRDAPDSYWAHYARAKFLLEQGKFSESEKEVDTAEKILPHLFETSELKGAIAGSQGKYVDALLYSKHAMDIDPKRPGAQQNYALALLKLNKYKESTQFIIPLLTKFPRDTVLRLYLTISMYKEGNVQEAMRISGKSEQWIQSQIKRFDADSVSARQ